MNTLFLFISILVLVSSLKVCPQNKLECLRKHLTTDPSECESDSKEEGGKNPNLEIIPEETKDLGPYALNNLQYTQLLKEIKDLKVWKASDDCTVWSTTIGKKQRLTKSSEVWLSLAKLLRSQEWEEKLVLLESKDQVL